MILDYYAAPVDDDGEPLVPSLAWQAVKAYVIYSHKLWMRNRFQHSVPSKNNPVALSELQMAQNNWFLALAAAQAELVKPRGIGQLREIGEAYIYSFTNEWPIGLNSCCKSYYTEKSV